MKEARVLAVAHLAIFGHPNLGELLMPARWH